MEQCKTAHGFSQSFSPPNMPPSASRQRSEGEMKDAIAERKVRKANSEKLRRDSLKEQFHELSNTLGIYDPDRPKNDKASILTDAIQMVEDLTAEISRLKAECAALSEESRELTQEKNELREEGASLKSDIENLNVQYQRRMRVMFPWAPVDPSLVVAPSYSYTVPVPVPPGPIPMHPALQPFLFFGNQNPGAIGDPCSIFIPYPIPTNPPNERPASQYASGVPTSSEQDSRRDSNTERCDDPNDVATELELKIPGSSAQKDTSTEERKGKQCQRKERNIANSSSSSNYSSSQGLQDSSSYGVGDLHKSNN